MHVERSQNVEQRKDYLSIKELCKLIPYEEQTIRNLMTQGKLVQGTHYFKPNGRLIFKWTAIVNWIEGGESGEESAYPCAEKWDALL
jgi:hypothetical protein